MGPPVSSISTHPWILTILHKLTDWVKNKDPRAYVKASLVKDATLRGPGYACFQGAQHSSPLRYEVKDDAPEQGSTCPSTAPGQSHHCVCRTEAMEKEGKTK